MLRPLLFRLAEDRLALVLLLVMPPLLWFVPLSPLAIMQLVQWQTITILTGLILLSRGLEDSGYLGRLGLWLIQHLHTERLLALVLVLFSAVLSMLLTNDVTLFIVVPLTLALRGVATVPVGRLIVFEALAVNAGSAISPIGNPQNLFLWQTSGSGFVGFTLAMLPVGLALLGCIAVLLPLAFPAQRLQSLAALALPPVKPRTFWVSLLCYPVFLVAAELGQSAFVLSLLLLIYLRYFRAVVMTMDWPLLLVFVLMFIDLGLVAQMPVVVALAGHIVQLPGSVLTAAALLSQLISNVPTAIFLGGLGEEWKAVAWGVNIGGFGFMLGSLANLIALRMAGERGLWREFHRWSIPLLLMGWLAGAVLFDH